MYIELFILDNFIMDALLLKLAAAMCAVPLRAGRTVAFSCVGTLMALASLAWQPLTTLPAKLATTAVMALALKPESAAQYLRALLCVTASAFVTGGLAFVIALAGGGFEYGGALYGTWTLRAALVCAGLAAFGPALARRLRMSNGARRVKVFLAAGEEEHTLRGIMDTGSSLHEPISGLPVIVVNVSGLAQKAKIPVPASTVAGERLLYAMRPDVLIVDGRASDALIAPVEEKLRGAEAIIPYMIFGEVQ